SGTRFAATRARPLLQAPSAGTAPARTGGVSRAAGTVSSLKNITFVPVSVLVMENLSSAYACLLEVCGPWGILLLACTILLFFIQFWYWVGYYGRIPTYRNAARSDARPPVS